MNTTICFVRRFLAAGILTCVAAVCQAQSTNLLYNAPASGARNNYIGAVGCKFQVGSSNIVVSHLGYFSTDTNNGLSISHPVGILSASSLSSPTVLGRVTVPAGTAGYWASNYYWVQLDPPILLNANTSYLLAGVPAQTGVDSWPDLFTPTWNTYFVGANGTGTRTGLYAPNNANGAQLPPIGGFSTYGGNQTYGCVEMANMPVGPAKVGVQTTSVSTSVGLTLSVVGFASGQLPITYQWYQSPGTAVANQTNSTLTISNAQMSASGTYYLIASNALGSEQSANVSVSVTAVPVSITKQPTNLTVFQNYTATFSVTAAGSQPISYQWSRNGSAITGATSSSYSLTAALANNGDTYSCYITNSISTITTTNAVLAVVPNAASPAEYLHGAFGDTSTNSFSGLVGGLFTTGNSPTLVSHLGFFAVNYADQTDATLSGEHHVGLFSADGTVLYASVDIQPGTYGVTNGYIWAPLNPPFVLATNTTYLLVAEGGGDHWGDTYPISDINPFYVGTNTSSFSAVYCGGSWPTVGTIYGRYGGQMYSAPNMALLPVGISVAVQPTNVSQYAGVDATLSALVGGQPPVSVQWYEEPGTVLAGDTNLILDLGNITASQAGNYYVIASNSVTGVSAQSVDAPVTVLSDNPAITQDIQSQSNYLYQTVQFTAGTMGRPPLSYQWTFDGHPIAGATNSVLTLQDVSAASAGTYQLIISNAYGVTNSSVASLQVTTPVWGGYASGVMMTNLLFYYRFSDVSNFDNSISSVAVNQGSLGTSANATYEGGCAEISGPTNIMDLDETTNPAVSLDGYDADVLIPSQGNLTVSNCTIAAWVYETTDPQSPNAAIFYHRQSSVFGLSVNPNANNLDQLRVTWGGNFRDSQLQLTPNQWVFVAMVVSPTNIVAYMNDGTGMQSTNMAASNASATFNGVSYIGYDTANAGRRWSGGLDEVMVFNEALTPSEVNSLYLGVPQTATLTIAPATGGKLAVTWPGGTLQEATSVSGPWTPTTGATNGVYTLPTAGTMKFYRVKLQ